MARDQRGMLVSIEGVDAVGKRTQTSLLSAWLASNGRSAKTLSFPDYGTAIGEEIRRFLHGGISYPPEVRHILFAANRWERKEGLESMLRGVDAVIVNRYSESNLAYGVANGLSLEWLVNLEHGLPKSDLVVVLDAPTAGLRSRRGRSKDEYERDAALQERTRQAYLRLAGDFGWKIIDATGGIEATSQSVIATVSNWVKSPGRTV